MAERPTHCPNCGLALPEQPLSLCAYCAMPIGLEDLFIDLVREEVMS